MAFLGVRCDFYCCCGRSRSRRRRAAAEAEAAANCCSGSGKVPPLDFAGGGDKPARGTQRDDAKTSLNDRLQLEGVTGGGGASQGNNGVVVVVDVVEERDSDAQTRTTRLLRLVVLATVGGTH